MRAALMLRRTEEESSSKNRQRFREARMIPGSFEYHRPTNLNEAVALMSSLDVDARVIAGGHSLIPMMKLRLATPTHLVDLAAVEELRGVKADGGDIVVGAMTTQHELIASEVLAARLPIIRETALLIADPQVRYVGTLGGNVANGDPGNDMPALMTALGAIYVLSGKGGERRVAARDYYQGAYTTAAKSDEILTTVRIAAPPAGHGYAYEKLKRKVGDYATAAAAVVLTVSGGVVATCSIGLTNVADTALFAVDAARAVVGSNMDRATLARASAAAEAIAAPVADGRGSAEYRRKMAGVMTARALARAYARANG
jgi:aerobic carbon-monoxide dehydrogenase medium subunit